MTNLTTTPRRTYGRLTSNNTTTHCVTSNNTTPTHCVTSNSIVTRTPKRKLHSNIFNSDVETEFYRVFSDVKRQKCEDLSFLFRGACNNIGTSTVGMYGEISHSSLKVVCRKLVEFGLDEKSVVLDLGSGRGVPNFVFATDANTFSSIGVEKCPIAYLNSINNICISICNDINKIRSNLHITTTDTFTINPINTISLTSTSSTSPGTSDSLSSSGSDSSILSYDSPSCGGLVNTELVKEEEEYEYSVNTQLEPDEPFDEYSETPTKFLKSPISNFNTINTLNTMETVDTIDTELNKLTPINELEVVNNDFQRGLEEFKNKTPSLPLAFVNEDIIAYDSFEGVTHFYSFDIAMERALISNMVYQFKNTSTAYVFASFISDLLSRFDLTGCFLAAKIPCRMAGSGEGKTCYIYVKNDWKNIKKQADSKLLKLFQANNSKSNNSQFDELKSNNSQFDKLRFDNLKCNVNNFDEPYSSLDMIKLSKMSLYYQYKWYLKRLGKFYKPFVTRSHSRDVSIREKLASERDSLIEQIAHTNSQEPRNKLKQHIQKNFKITSTFP